MTLFLFQNSVNENKYLYIESSIFDFLLFEFWISRFPSKCSRTLAFFVIWSQIVKDTWQGQIIVATFFSKKSGTYWIVDSTLRKRLFHSTKKETYLQPSDGRKDFTPEWAYIATDSLYCLELCLSGNCCETGMECRLFWVKNHDVLYEAFWISFEIKEEIVLIVDGAAKTHFVLSS